VKRGRRGAHAYEIKWNGMIATSDSLISIGVYYWKMYIVALSK